MNYRTFLLTFILIGSLSFAHDEKTHGDKVESPKQSYLEIVKASYLNDIKPILKKKCYDCHSGQTVYPWYYQVPLIKQLIDHDIKEAREHIDMSADYPFKGHGNLINDLEEIKKEIVEDKMPPFLYRLIHRDSPLTEAEKKIVFAWIEKSKKYLKK